MNSLSSFHLGGGAILLILAIVFVLALVVIGVLGLVFMIVRSAANQPVQTTSIQPPEIAAQKPSSRDNEHLRLLAIFHFVLAGLALVGVGFLCVHFALMQTMFSRPEIWRAPHQVMPPKAFLNILVWSYLLVGFLLLAGLVLNVLSGFFLLHKRNRLFSQIVGGLNWLQVPLGTVLGVFTILVLSRDSVRQLYEGEARRTQ